MIRMQYDCWRGDMLKLFLVEDEIIMRDGIRNYIKNDMPQIEFVGEASDGELAYPMIKELKPDILLTDIKMPFMDGLELSRILKTEMKQLKIIIVSGYDDFEYAKQAINIGVTDYLLKPVSSIKLYEAIHRVSQMIESEKKQNLYQEFSYQDQEESKRRERQKLFRTLITHQLSTQDILEQAKSLGLKLDSRFYCVCITSIFQNEEDSRYSLETHSACMKEMQTILSSNQNCYCIEQETEGWILIYTGDSEDEIKKEVEHNFDIIKETMKNYRQFNFFVGVGSIVNRISYIVKTYEEASRAFSFRYLVKPNQIIYYQETGNFSEQNQELDITKVQFDKIDRSVLLRFLKNGLQEEIKNFLLDYFNSIGKENMKSLIFRQYLCMDIYFGTISFLEDLGVGNDCIMKQRDSFQLATSFLSTIDDMVSCLSEFMQVAMSVRDELANKKYHGLIQHAKDYILKHYDTEEISLNSIASIVNISPNHFSTIFSQEMGVTFIEYLTKIRMDKAKEYLMCSNMKSSEIGYAVGYKDPHYFSFIFKKTQNMSPKEYRQRTKG